MKTLTSIVLAASVGFASAYLWVSNRSQALLKRELASREAAWLGEKETLENELAAARSQAGQVQTVTRTQPSSPGGRFSPREILDTLTKINPNEADNRNQALRQVVHNFELLTQAGAEALPVIREFLAQNIDVDYTSPEVAGGESGERGRATRWLSSRASARTDFLVPPSLRLGLLDVLEQIGGPDSEQVLAQTLRTTGRGVEVAYLARILQELAPDRYRDVALGAAKDLLSNPPTIENPNRLDDNARTYLYQVLAMFDDTSFAEVAKGILVTPEGRIDRQALNYLNSSLKEQAIPAIYEAYKDPRITNQWEKSNLLNLALNYTGPNAQANEMLTAVVLDEAIPSGMRAFTIQSLAGGWRSGAPKDPQVLQSRLQLLESLKGKVTDERVRRSIEDTAKNLQNIINGEPARNNAYNRTPAAEQPGLPVPPPLPAPPQ